MILSVLQRSCHGLLTSLSNLTVSTRRPSCQPLRFISNMSFEDIYVAFSRKSLRITPFAKDDPVSQEAADIDSNGIADEFDIVKSFYILKPVTSPGDKIPYISDCISCFNVGKTARQFGAKTYHAANIDDTGGLVKRVLCVTMSENKQAEKNINEIVSSHCMKTYEKIVKAENSAIGIHQVFDGASQKIIKEKKCILKVMNNSPFFAERNFSAIFQDFQSAKDFLLKCSHIPEAQELLDITNRLVPPSMADASEANLAHPFVVVEGMDATGKTTLAKELESRMKATRYSTPPPCVLHLRKFFDDFPENIRRAYYTVGNYIVARQIAETCRTNAVIMDRFWHSSAAYAITNETSVSDMPTRGHWVYEWPDDLLRPTIVLFLTVSEEIRKSRIGNRPGAKTVEEKVLDADMVFRQRLCESYKRMQNPECVEIDAGGNVESVVEAACAELTNNGITLS